jgi:hypothetical protein
MSDSDPRRRIAAVIPVLVAALAPLAAPAPAQPPTPPDTLRAGAAPDSAAIPFRESIPSGDLSGAPAGTSIVPALLDEGFENVTVTGEREGVRVALENRRHRHSATVLGLIARAAGGPVLTFERRLGLVAAAVSDPGDGSPPRRVSHPSDGRFPPPPPGSVLAPTARRLDLLVGPLVTYRLGGILDPVLVRVEMQPELRYNPWPGGRLRTALVIPVWSNFDADALHPDADRVRPGPVALEQFAWSPGTALLSATAGLLGNNRYGFSAGVARPLMEGALLLDAQADVTGFFAISDSGVVYSTPSRWTGFAGVLYRPRALDLAIRLRAARFIHDDEGLELEVRRSMGDLDVAFSALRTLGTTIGGVRLVLPVPPMVRPVAPIRALPVDRFTVQYREETVPVGVTVANVASREDYLRQLDRPSLEANQDRYRAALTGSRVATNHPIRRVSLSGMTGFAHTPWCGVMGDKEVEVGYNRIPRGAAHQYRGRHHNDVYYGALGFLPHLEAGIRWTVMPGAYPFRDQVPESRHVDNDRMFSARLEVIPPAAGRPGLALGAEDLRGTRRFHSTYAVAGVPFAIYRLQNRVTLGYAARVFENVARRTLDGLFGACEVSPWRPLAVALEHDTEKWNSILSVELGFGLRARVALLDLRHASLGAGWFKAL